MQDVGDDDHLGVPLAAADQVPGWQFVEIRPHQRVVPQLDLALGAEGPVDAAVEGEVRGGARRGQPGDLAEQLAGRVHCVGCAGLGRASLPIHLLDGG